MRLSLPGRVALASAGLLLLSGRPAAAQDTPKGAPPQAAAEPRTGEGFASIRKLYEHYDQEFRKVDARRIADLTKLAGTLQGDEAEAAYHAAFNLAVTRDMYEAAERGADQVIASGKFRPQTVALATFVKVVGQIQREQYEPALKNLDRFLQGQRADASTPDRKLDPNLTLAVGEAVLQHLIHAGRYNEARQAAEKLAGHPDASVRDHFVARKNRLGMLGQAAPEIVATDLDGKPVSLADFKGKVVLVDFWATWCPPCVAEMPHYNALMERYGKRGFAILGVNVDTALEAAKANPGQALGAVRKFLIAYRASWPNVANNFEKNGDIAKAYGVTDIPATFLVDKTGKIIDVELVGQNLDEAVSKALGEETKTGSK